MKTMTIEITHRESQHPADPSPVHSAPPSASPQSIACQRPRQAIFPPQTDTTYKSVTTDGKPSGTNATRIDTANVTVWAPLPLYAVVMPTTKNTTAKMIAMLETNMTKRALRGAVSKRKKSADGAEARRTSLG